MTDVEFDHHSPEYAAHWREINAGLRAKCPVAHTAAHGGYWVVSDYQDVAEIARDDATFSSCLDQEDGTRGGVTIPVTPLRQVPIEMDPPEFFDYRRLLNPAFSPAASKTWEPFIRAATTFCIDQVIESGSSDLVHDLTAPVPAILTLEVLGMSKDNWRSFSDTTHNIVHAVPGSPEHTAAFEGMGAIIETVMAEVADRRKNPTDDLTSKLVHAKINGELMDDQRLIEVITLVIFGGTDTTGSLISSVLDWLGRNPEVRAQLAADYELLPRATEEFLRYFSPVQGLSRTATRDCVVGGQEISRGDRLYMSWASANFDESEFTNPNEVQLDRYPNRHQAFGLGVHRCLGSNIARSQFRVVLEEVLRRIPNYEVLGEPQRYGTIGVVNGLISLPVTFEPGPREGSLTMDDLTFANVAAQNSSGGR